jgi:monothiol glutaredoxin
LQIFQPSGIEPHMSLPQELESRIRSLVTGNRVVLFMKGTKQQPRCGFSAAVVNVLDELHVDFKDVDVLAEPEIREAIKVFSSWPTLPQLYIGGEFVGGADIVRDMYGNGLLHEKLGLRQEAIEAPKITVTDSAAIALKAAASETDAPCLRLEIDGRYRHNLFFDQKKDSDFEVAAAGMKFLFDRGSARRAAGLVLDYVEGAGGTGFKIDNPNAPAGPKQMSAKELAQKLAEGVRLYDVRTEEEVRLARIEGARRLDDVAGKEIESLPKDTTLVFFCHHGGRSQAAAEHFASKGFKKVYNLMGGIDAWSRDVDPKVPRY